MTCESGIEILLKGKNETTVLFRKDGIKYEIRGFSIEEIDGKKVIILENG